MKKLSCYAYSGTKRDRRLPHEASLIYADIQYHVTHINALRERLAKEGYEVSFLDNGKGLV